MRKRVLDPSAPRRARRQTARLSYEKRSIDKAHPDTTAEIDRDPKVRVR